ncbi:hypothetical protein FACS1894167_10630 [Synergistales bacterium]|nr:hypothetical protein FACS1894167_10630 [Synergistales bacterium]
MKTPQTMGKLTKQGYATIYELDLTLDDAFDYVSEPSNFLTVHDGIVRELNHLGISGDDDELYTKFTELVKAADVKIDGFIKRNPQDGKSYEWFYKSKSGTEDCLPRRSQAIKLCFAFNMDVDRAADFLWKVCKLNGFCFRRAEDIIQCYCLANSLPFIKVSEIKKAYDDFVPILQPSVEHHITRTQTLRHLFGDLKNVSREDFIDKLCANKHNFLGYSRTAHAEMKTIYEELKAEIHKNRAIESRSAWLTAQAEFQTKNDNEETNISYRTTNLAKTGNLNLVGNDGEIIHTAGDDDEYTYEFMCRQLAEKYTLDDACDVAVRNLRPDKKLCYYVSDLVSFLTQDSLAKCIQEPKRATETEHTCARMIFVLMKFAKYVLE